MAAGADGLTITGNAHVTNFTSQIDFTWTMPDDAIGAPPSFWYAINSEFSDDGGATWNPGFGFPTSTNVYHLYQDGDADLSDTTPHTRHYRLKTLFTYNPFPYYSNAVSADVANIVEPSKTPASNLRGECSG